MTKNLQYCWIFCVRHDLHAIATKERHDNIKKYATNISFNIIRRRRQCREVIKFKKFIGDVKFRLNLNNVFGLRRYSTFYAHDASGDTYDRSSVRYVF